MTAKMGGNTPRVMSNLVKGAKSVKSSPSLSAMKGGVTNLGKSVTTASLSTPTTAPAVPTAGASYLTRIASRAAGGAGLSYSLGQLATGTETGRAIGKSIGDTFPGLKSTMAQAKDYRDNVIAPKLGVKSLSTAADTPYISKAVKTATDAVSSAATPAPKAETSSFKQAFAAARKEAEAAGSKSSGQFTYKGTKYQTNIQGKGTAKNPEEKFVPMSQQKVTSVGKISTDSGTGTSTTTPGSSDIKAQPAPPSSATAGMSSAAEKSGIPQTPTKSGTEFGAGKDVSSTPMPTTPAPAPATASPAAAATNASSGATTPAAKAPEPDIKGSVTPAPAPEKKQKESGTTLQNVAESFVSVGDNKYRIV